MSKKGNANLGKPTDLMSRVRELSKQPIDDIIASFTNPPPPPQETPSQPRTIEQILAEDDATRSPAQLNQMTGDRRPSYADGSSPQTPINESVLEPMDRLKLSLGDKEGGLKYLQEKYGAASVDTDGDFVVQKDGQWYSVDARNGLLGGAKNAWDLTTGLLRAGLVHMGDPKLAEKMFEQTLNKNKEMVGDIAGALPTAGKIALLLGGAGLVGPGAGLAAEAISGGVAGAAGSGIATSMGKVAGTYSGDPTDQLEEAGMEFLLNATGNVILPGLGQAATKLGVVKGLAKTAEVMSKTPEAVKDAMASFGSALSNVGKPQIQRFWDRPAQVAAYAKKFAEDVNYEPKAFEMQMKYLLKGADESRKSLSKWYGGELKNIGEKIGDDFAINVSQPAAEVMLSLRDAGLVKIGEDLVPVLRTSKEINELIQARGASSPLLDMVSGDPQSYSIMKDVFQAMKPNLGESAPLKGAAAFKRYQELESALSQRIFTLKGRAGDAKVGALVREIEPFLRQQQSALDAQVSKGLIKAGKQDIIPEYAALKSQYRQLSTEADSILELQALNSGATPEIGRTAARNKAAGIIQNLAGGQKLRVAQQARRGNVLAAQKSLTEINPEIGRLFDKVLDIESAHQFTPRFNSSFVKFGPAVLLSGAGAAAIGEGDSSQRALQGAAGVGIGLVAGAPNTLFQVLKANKAAGQIVNKGLFRARQILMGMSPSDRKELLSNPEWLRQYQGTIINSAQQYMQSGEQLKQIMEQGQKQ